VNNSTNLSPSEIFKSVNAAIRENISRMGSDHYMTLTAIRLDDSQMTLAGKHQDVILYRAAHNKTEVLPTKGTWLGIVDHIEDHVKDVTVDIKEGDIILLFTDGITEGTNARGEMYGQERLERALNEYADLPVGKLLDKIIEDVVAFQAEQADDMTVLVIRKCSAASHY
jgi:serine phosphatase RsbU (regulator of sigma subunit)